MKILTSAQMREIDRKTIEDIGIPGPVLMENAGLRVAAALRGLFPEKRGGRVVIVAGRGNNGGDGLVAARHLQGLGYEVEVLLLARVEELKGEALLNAQICRNMGVPLRETAGPQDWAAAARALQGARIIVDAIFGTGLVKPAEGLYAQAIQDINKAKAFKLSIDIPSGLSSDTSRLIGPSVKADLTVALAAPKVGHVLPPAEDMVGELLIADIGIPRALFDDRSLTLEMVDDEVVIPLFRRRKRETHKGTYGHLLVISGSLGKTGAAVMAGRAALKMGAGLVTVATAASCLPLVARSTPELMTEPLAETKEKTIAAEAAGRAVELCRGKDGLVLGPGLSNHPSTARFVGELLAKVKLPVVIDADGLNILAENQSLMSQLPRPAILTPHPGEFGRFLGLDAAGVLDQRLALVQEFAKKHGVILVLKGHRTLTAAPDGRIFINSTGNPGLATGGSGDVLSGMIGSQLVQEKEAWKAALSAVYVHGLAGDLAAQKLSQKALTATDIIRFLPAALKELEEKASNKKHE
ncbi:MAG TPA: NAD(P)H-hydrate dehydratase [Acidobacteriota bacterium]